LNSRAGWVSVPFMFASGSHVATLSDRLALIIAGLWRALAARCETDRAAAPILALAGLRLHELAARFAALVASVRAGRLRCRRELCGNSGWRHLRRMRLSGQAARSMH